jgi:predicted acylesterase/phospholipase RssA
VKTASEPEDRSSAQDATKTEPARRKQMDVERATEVLSSGKGAEPSELLELATSLKEHKEMGHARRLLMLACERVKQNEHPDLYVKIFQQAAHCTYNDADLPVEWKLDRAEEILSKACDLAHTDDPETLGIAGGIFKRRWQLDGKQQNLERAFLYYLKGYAQGAPSHARADVLAYLAQNPGVSLNATRDYGYAGVNAAFLLDVLAVQELREAERVGLPAKTANLRREQARSIREEIARTVPVLLIQQRGSAGLADWWPYAAVGEALFGLERYPEALEWLVDRPERAGLHVGLTVESAPGRKVPEWEYETTARQLARLARLHCQAAQLKQGLSAEITEEEFEKTDAADALRKFLGHDARALLSAFRGRYGLGLSGGGFRASLFHIGVLARLAEIDALRHVEVLSCVSGGSIVGAYYYLEVRKLLESKIDSAIAPKDYVDIVKRMQTEFLAGVQRNIRTRVLAELSTNLKMIFCAGYSRTVRVGELYERELYARISDRNQKAPAAAGPGRLRARVARLFGFHREQRLLEGLLVAPLVEDEPGAFRNQSDFNPRRDNWRRNNKVPVLVLNACSLNTGHTWQFTARYMGEPPAPIQADIDCNYRLRRFYYEDAPAKAAPITLGLAVAASSCVPGLFEPVVLDELYADGDPRRISVRLVDGGVCDNQGIGSLVEQDCSVMLISDGSGQMSAADVPSSGVLGVPLRSNSILQARVREAQYTDVAARRRAGSLRGYMFVHLKQELAGKALAWRDCPPAERRSDLYDWRFDVSTQASETTSYGIPRDIQAKLAEIRTDLDSFSDAEAYALMASGYRMAAAQFRGPRPCVEGFQDSPQGEWDFLAIERALAGGESTQRLHELLDAGSSSVFKVWRLLLPLRVLTRIAVAGLVAGAIAVFVGSWHDPLIPNSVYAWTTARLTFRAVGLAIVSFVGVMALTVVLNAAFGKARGRHVLCAIRWRDTLKDIAIGIVMSLAGWVLARLHLLVFDPLYLRSGKLDRLSKQGAVRGSARK